MLCSNARNLEREDPLSGAALSSCWDMMAISLCPHGVPVARQKKGKQDKASAGVGAKAALRSKAKQWAQCCDVNYKDWLTTLLQTQEVV